MRRLLPLLLVTAAVAAGCGGGAKTVGGCKLEANAACENADLSDETLKGDLAGIDLDNANLVRVKIDGADLSRASLTNANLSSATITDTNLSDANLTRANLAGATITGTDLEGAVTCGTLRTDGTIDDADCPTAGNTGGGTTTAATTTQAGTPTTQHVNPKLPEIVSFSGPQTARCKKGQRQTTVTLTWKTRNASYVGFEIDGQAPGAQAGFPVSGSGQEYFDCNRRPHTYTLTAGDTKGYYATDSVTVQPAT